MLFHSVEAWIRMAKGTKKCLEWGYKLNVRQKVLKLCLASTKTGKRKKCFIGKFNIKWNSFINQKFRRQTYISLGFENIPILFLYTAVGIMNLRQDNPVSAEQAINKYIDIKYGKCTPLKVKHAFCLPNTLVQKSQLNIQNFNYLRPKMRHLINVFAESVDYNLSPSTKTSIKIFSRICDDY